MGTKLTVDVGMIMSDWIGVYSTSESIKAGLDLEMPCVFHPSTFAHSAHPSRGFTDELVGVHRLCAVRHSKGL